MPTRETTLDSPAEHHSRHNWRHRLVIQHMGVTRRIARSYRAPRHQEDLEQVAYLALVHAAERFDPARELRFLAFAAPTIHGEIKHYLRDHTWDVHVPRRLQERAVRAQRVRDELAAGLGRSPTIDELAARLGVDRGAAQEALEASGARDARSLDAPSQDGDGAPPIALRAVSFDDERLPRALDRVVLRSALSVLSDLERQAIGLRFIAEMTQNEIAAQLGISQMQVSRILRRAIARMSALAPDERPSPEHPSPA